MTVSTDEVASTSDVRLPSTTARSPVPVTAGYASYTYQHPNFLVRYPHLKRMRLVAAAISSLLPTAWLDFGCGDGAVAVYVHEHHDFRSARTVLYDPWDAIRAEIPASRIPRASIVGAADDIGGDPFDLITALEVLEHLPLPERVKFYQCAAKLLAPGGRCLIEVPVEYGPMLLAKEYARAYLKGRKSAYRRGELQKAAFFGAVEDTLDRFNPDDTRQTISPHHGFDTQLFLRELATIGIIVSVRPSPFPLLPAILNQCLLIEFRPIVRRPAMIEHAIQAFALVVKGLRPYRKAALPSDMLAIPVSHDDPLEKRVSGA